MKLRRKSKLADLFKEEPKKEVKKSTPKKTTEKVEKETLENEENYQNKQIGEVILSDKAKLVVSTCRSGEFGLPHADIRLFLTTERYTGATKTGVRIPLDKLGDIINHLCEVENIAEENNWYTEFEDEDNNE